MRHRLSRCIIFLLCLALLPGLPLLAAPIFPAVTPSLSAQMGMADFPEGAETILPEGSSDMTSLPSASDGRSEQTEASDISLPHYYLILDVESDSVLQLTPAEYIMGVTAAEIPISYETEALKAQAVAAHSYALWQMGRQLKNPDSSLKGAFLSTDSAHFQAYLSEEERKTLWGDGFEEKETKLREAVQSVINQILTYQGEPVAAAFHALSAGETESAENVWGQAQACLTPVSSPWDADNPELTAETVFTVQEAAAILSARLEAPQMSEDPSEWITIQKRSASGMVTEAQAGGTTVSGTELREWFGLPSANFEVAFSDDAFCFTTKGKGHGVGMSQYGANAMALEGSDFSEILLHYYPGAVISVLQSESTPEESSQS